MKSLMKLQLDGGGGDNEPICIKGGFLNQYSAERVVNRVMQSAEPKLVETVL